MTAFYNEIDPFAAAWLRNLIVAGHIADGIVDERDIRDIRPDELSGFTQCHLFAGIGLWSLALRQAGWPDDRPVWTGSCPCQPFSTAGRRAGTADERHLWPAFFHHIDAIRPPVVMGEQVAGPDGLAWLDLVSDDLEGVGYAVRSADTCAASVGAPHIRQRLYWMADAAGERRQGLDALLRPEARGRLEGDPLEAAGRGEVVGLEHASSYGRLERRAEPSGRSIEPRRGDGWMGDAMHEGLAVGSIAAIGSGDLRHQGPAVGAPGALHDAWGAFEWLACTDGKYRPVEPGLSPLAHGHPARVGKLRAYGNAIAAPLAAQMIRMWASD